MLHSVCVLLFVLRRSADVTSPEQGSILYVCFPLLAHNSYCQRNRKVFGNLCRFTHSVWGEYKYGFIVCLYVLCMKASQNAHFEVIIGHVTKPHMPEKCSGRYVNAAFIPILCICLYISLLLKDLQWNNPDCGVKTGPSAWPPHNDIYYNLPFLT